ncbi:hypothetical protein P4U03_30550 [Bacillus mycoides]|uniref:Peptidase M23 n=1 Tax=Bacillus thuringiensis serovar navarrensis TaxID=339658 RepID=A0A243AKV6_BACTU|nr:MULTISPECIES: hypothetical protein [Bacillus cereus group]MED1270804.1 hypothetical protein [Bacillus mycoides]OFD35803.1 hypothetical protein BWGOE1_57420 [Bacillus mycoides]OFD35974.1 hypothetical protein BWGOE3_57430 [Bacillus mycoides]OFD36191.1 hypothetical protein BWGOE2_55290 [Bacillus mycoides]OTY23610.1 hypothetical protein BK732_07830 [Bacillus thuringiensis serovar navarrensis]
MKKKPIFFCTLGISIGLLSTSVIGATSDTLKTFVKEDTASAVEQTNSEGVQPRWIFGKAKSNIPQEFVISRSVPANSNVGYASAGGLVGGHAPAIDIEEFGR